MSLTAAGAVVQNASGEIVLLAGPESAAAGYTTFYGYDQHRRLSSLTYPNNELVTTYYNPLGLPSRMVSSVGGTLVDGTIPGGGQSNGVGCDLAGRLTQLRFPAAPASGRPNLWRTYAYAPFNQQNSDGRGLDAIYVGTTSDGATNAYNRLRLEYDYDSFGNIKTLREGFSGNGPTTHSFSYNAYNLRDDAATRDQAYAAGATAFVSKCESPESPVRSIRDVRSCGRGLGEVPRPD